MALFGDLPLSSVDPLNTREEGEEAINSKDQHHQGPGTQPRLREQRLLFQLSHQLKQVYELRLLFSHWCESASHLTRT